MLLFPPLDRQAESILDESSGVAQVKDRLLSRRVVSAGLAVAGSVLIGPHWLACRRRASNVVLITIDTLRADHLHRYGYSRRTTPALDRLASESLLFERAWSQAPWTLPSMAALLTSRYPGELGIRGMQSKLPGEVPLLSDALRAGGFETAGMVAASLCGAKRGFDRGFDTFDGSNARGHFESTSEKLTDLALAFLERPRVRPFFLWVHYFDPHHAYLDHPEYRYFVETDYRGPVRPGQDINELFELNANGSLGAPDLQRLRDLYDSDVAFTDHHVGRLLDGLRQRGLYDETLIVVTSDHGEEFGDHGGLSHTYTLYQELMHVPLLVKRAHSSRSATIREPVALLDVAPTILEEVGLPPLPRAAGRSLLRNRPPVGERTIMFETTQEKNNLRAAIAYPNKLVLDLATGAILRFDLERDPGEHLPRNEPDASGFTRLGHDLGRWLRERRSAESSEVELGEGEREALRSLGYL